MRGSARWLLPVLAVGVFGVATVADSKKFTLCPGGRFVVPKGQAPLVEGSTTPDTDSIVFGNGGQLVLEECGGTTVKLHAKKKFTTVNAKWAQCGNFQKVKLVGKIASPACDTLSGTVKGKKLQAKSFTAKLSRCGDGILDRGGGEECDTTAPDGDADCPGRCVPAGACTCAPPTTTTSPATSTTTTSTSTVTTTTVPDALACTGTGVDATVTLAGGAADIGELLVDVVYPQPLDIPGTNAAARVTELGDGAPGLDSPKDLDTNFDGIDDTVYNDFDFNSGATVPGPFEEILFDCPAGNYVGASQFQCVVKSGKDSGGHALAAGELPTCSVGIDIPASTTTTTTLPPVCGDGTVQAPETCDDGNTVDCSTVDCGGANPVDHCPSNCIVATCNAQAAPAVNVSLKVTPPNGVILGSLQFFLDYPEGQARNPTVTPAANVVAGTNDIDYGIILQALDNGGSGLPASPTALFHIKFDSCLGAPLPAASDFKCSVNDAADDSQNTVDPSTVGCTITIP